MKHLYQKIYLTIIVSLILMVLIGGLFMKLVSDRSRFDDDFAAAGAVALALLPRPDASLAEKRRKIEHLSKQFKHDIAIFDKNKRLVVTTNNELPAPQKRRWKRHPDYDWRSGSWMAKLPDDRWIVVRPLDHERRMFYGPLGGILFLGGIALAIAIAIYPAVRGLTRRLERLQKGVETLGSGDLTARVKIEGKDEIARLAQSFNVSAERIGELMEAHKLLLANASHELRTPLSRLRVTVELLKDKADPKHKENLETDIAELDSLIDEILLASRLSSLDELGRIEEVDLLALAAEETSRFPEFCLDGEQATLQGDPRLLRRMIRNLLVNADRHGKLPVVVRIKHSEGAIELSVLDSGDGITEEDSEKIFTPFYRPESSVSATGTGLGLSLVQQIAERHNGTASIIRQQDGKNGFVIRFSVSS